MPSHPRNMPEQEHSIRARSDELFVEEAPGARSGRSSKPFAAYLRETPAQPLSPVLKGLFWLIGILVGVLFLMAVWRVSHHQGAKPTADSTPERVSKAGDAG